jgi:hypothetical protein
MLGFRERGLRWPAVISGLGGQSRFPVLRNPALKRAEAHAGPIGDCAELSSSLEVRRQ